MAYAPPHERRGTMNIKIYKRSLRLFRIALALMSAITFVGVADAQENIGTQRQGLVGGTMVSADLQEQYGLVTLSTGCSGSLLRNNWVITAAHCVDNPDPENPGQFITVPENSVTLTGNWRTTQPRQSARIITFRPNDVAIIRVVEPFTGSYANEGYNRGLYRDSLKSVNIMAFGRGINQFAQGSGASATPSQTDGQFRVGYFTTDKAEDTEYEFPTGGQTIAGGDSGGPSYVKTASGELLAGVHSLCQFQCMPGRMCVAPTVWRWVIATPRCTDASIAPLWDDINRYLGVFVPPKPFEGTFAPPGPSVRPAWIYAVRPDGHLGWYRHDGAELGLSADKQGAWVGGNPASGPGWGDFKQVLPGGGNVIYALTHDGKLLWYRHNGFNTGARREWQGAEEVGTGWNSYKYVFSGGGSGILYAITPDGKLLWHKHTGHANGAWLWDTTKEIGHGWGNFKHVFSAGDGIIYAVTNEGKLLWYRHLGYADGAVSWQGSKEILRMGKENWADYKHVFSPGVRGGGNAKRVFGDNGGDKAVIYAIANDGRLFWYGHRYQDLTSFVPASYVARPQQVGHGWGDISQIIALLPGTPDVVR